MLRSFSDDDMSIIRAVVRDYRNRVHSKLPRNDDPTLDRAQERFIALPPSGGIPGVTRGAGTAPDVAGSAVCDIYVLQDNSGSMELVAATNVDRTVYNLSDVVIPQDYITISRDKFGYWIAPLYAPLIFGVMLAEDHPGKGVRFNVWVGTQSGDGWSYATGTDTEKAIDWRNTQDSYPYTGATGLGFRRAGGLIEIIDLDCPPSTGTGT